MSNNNSSDSSMALAFGMAIVAFIGFGIMMLACFLSLVLTVLALFAWNKPRRYGNTTVYPEDARALVLRGLFFAAMSPLFYAIIVLVLGEHFDWQVFDWTILGGYVFGTGGIMILEDDDTPQVMPVYSAPPAPPPVLPPTQLALPLPAEPFRYASWDDEEDQP